ncbi:hypothetical protein [Eubacterium oxidoreducens]|uniref:Uncharacterized protein n=1 Tax=Eubacterium oxidoreducens TaxID=1732 RepID=A0A1G6B2D4_EUBOX|nr:hypothetical protein [Eubacterium oxidoreducens]SDB14722.1 hypothetical protein SAMN02910417_01072 [Eubacterium oxidoreducens]
MVEDLTKMEFALAKKEKEVWKLREQIIETYPQSKIKEWENDFYDFQLEVKNDVVYIQIPRLKIRKRISKRPTFEAPFIDFLKDNKPSICFDFWNENEMILILKQYAPSFFKDGDNCETKSAIDALTFAGYLKTDNSLYLTMIICSEKADFTRTDLILCSKKTFLEQASELLARR